MKALDKWRWLSVLSMRVHHDTVMSISSPKTVLQEKPVFSLSRVQLSYEGRTVLTNVSFAINAGERVALVGKSGVGKSTLLSALREQSAKAVAWCPQESGLVPSLSVYHNMYMGGLHRHGSLYNLVNLLLPWPHAWHEVSELAALLQLEERLSCKLESLSGGQLQRVAIGRALFAQKDIFLGDEPVSAVDDYQGEQLLELIAQRHETLVLALHDVELALRVCDRVIGLKDGAIILDAQSATLTAADLAQLYH